jgi:ribonuclease P protein subunit RPR2
MKKKDKKKGKAEAIELMKKAEDAFPNQKLANSFVRKAREKAMNHNVRFPRDIKRKFCKHCYSFLKSGVNCRVRTRDGKVVYSCLDCGKFMRYIL